MIFIKIKKFILYILIILVALVLLSIVATTLLDNTGFGFETITFNNATALDVPSSGEAVSNKDAYGIYTYTDPKNNLNITSWNSLEQQTISGAKGQINKILSQKGSQSPTIESGVPIYYNSEKDLYYIQTSNDTTHDNIFISCKDKDLLLKIYGSIKYGYGNASKLVIDMSKVENNTESTANVTNTTANTTSNTNTASTQQSNYDESYYDESYSEGSGYDEGEYYYDESEGVGSYYDESEYYGEDYGYYEENYAY